MKALEKQERPEVCTQEHLEYLDALRESGITNMWGARPYLQKAFRKLKEKEASAVLLYWMRTFSERHPR
jgi:hypothetical protein